MTIINLWLEKLIMLTIIAVKIIKRKCRVGPINNLFFVCNLNRINRRTIVNFEGFLRRFVNFYNIDRLITLIVETIKYYCVLFYNRSENISELNQYWN